MRGPGLGAWSGLGGPGRVATEGGPAPLARVQVEGMRERGLSAGAVPCLWAR